MQTKCHRNLTRLYYSHNNFSTPKCIK